MDAITVMLHPLSIESGEDSGLAQVLIGSQEGPALRRVLAPLEGSGQLQSIRRPQVVAIHELDCLGSQRIRRLYNEPRVRQRSDQLASLCPVAGKELFHTHQSRQRARNLNWSRPPDDGLVTFVKGDGARRSTLTDAQWDQGASVPEG